MPFEVELELDKEEIEFRDAMVFAMAEDIVPEPEPEPDPVPIPDVIPDDDDEDDEPYLEEDPSPVNTLPFSALPVGIATKH